MNSLCNLRPQWGSKIPSRLLIWNRACLRRNDILIQSNDQAIKGYAIMEQHIKVQA